MFTGLIKDIGEISSLTRNTEGVEIIVKSSLIASQVVIDDSVSINGACQTVIAHNSSEFTVQAVKTTLEKTNFGHLKPGSPVNLELALRLSDRLGGHLVQGHVNGVGEVLGWENRGNNYVLDFKIPSEFLRYVVQEGSITLNGVSLTVSKLDPIKSVGQVSIIPHTWDNTIFKFSKVGDSLNLEVDILAKYVENLLFSREEKSVKESKISEEWLRSLGY